MLHEARGGEAWYIVAADDSGMTIEATGNDPEELANKVASWAQQEEDKWPEMGLIYMLVQGKDFE